jgi:hypothetical protein
MLEILLNLIGWFKGISKCEKKNNNSLLVENYDFTQQDLYGSFHLFPLFF